MNKIDATRYRRDLIDLSIKQYVLTRPRKLLGYDCYGLPIMSIYTIDNFAQELNTSIKAIRSWGKKGRVPKKYEVALIKMGVLPKEWELLK